MHVYGGGGGCPMHVYGGGEGVPCMYIITFYCSPAKKKCSDPHYFWTGDVTTAAPSS